MTALPEPLNRVDAIQQKIDKWHENNREWPRAHLGLSLLGHPCNRWIWLNFRWAVVERFPGRMLRLFRRGHREEQTIVEDLRAIGIEIHHTEADGEQTRVDFGSHVSGSVDGIIERGVPGAENTRHIAEFKTHSLKSFRELEKNGVLKAKKQHWWQMQGYMLGTGIERALYVAVCKDNDEMYTERVYFDEEKAKALIRRGHSLALCERLPEPLSADSTWWQCKMCPAHNFCFSSHLCEEVNCRTCAHVTPTKDGKWLCEHGTPYEISLEEQRAGCSCHTALPDLVPWQFCGGTDNGFCAKYIIKGKEYLNGAPFLTDGALTTHELLIIHQEKDIPARVPF